MMMGLSTQLTKSFVVENRCLLNTMDSTLKVHLFNRVYVKHFEQIFAQVCSVF
jgi:hypothetical protein